MLHAPSAKPKRGQKQTQVQRLQALALRVEYLWDLVRRRLELSETDIRRDIEVWGADTLPPAPANPVSREQILEDLEAPGTPYCMEALAPEPAAYLQSRMLPAARCPDGSLWVIDSQHHTAAAVEHLITALTYRLFDSTGPEMEAEVFDRWQLWEAESRELPGKSRGGAGSGVTFSAAINVSRG